MAKELGSSAVDRGANYKCRGSNQSKDIWRENAHTYRFSNTTGAIGAALSKKGEFRYTSHATSKKIPVQAPASRTYYEM